MNTSRSSLKKKGAPRKAGGPQHRDADWRRFLVHWILPTTVLCALALFWIDSLDKHIKTLSAASTGVNAIADSAAVNNSSVFQPTRRPFRRSVSEYFQWQPTPVQPIAFNHRRHLQNGMECTNCHGGVTDGPDAGIPSVAFCLACHEDIAKNNPEIKKLAAYAAKGQEVPWQPVYWFYPSEHVRFHHAPHIRAGVDCQKCHGDMLQQTVAVRSRNLNMKFCISCHREKDVSMDCITCHY